MTAYEALRVGEDASADEIRSAYRALAKRLHPDASGDPRTVRAFRMVTEAYELLRDPMERGRYDAFLARSRRPQPVVRMVTVMYMGTSTTNNATTNSGWSITI